MKKDKITKNTGPKSVKRKKMALGKGLEALIPGGLSAPSDDARDYLLCDVAIIKPNRYQPRLRFEGEEMAALTGSIRARGQQTPVDVVELGGGRFGLISGWRRYMAIRALSAETGESRFATILAVRRRPDTAGAAYVAMVE